MCGKSARFVKYTNPPSFHYFIQLYTLYDEYISLQEGLYMFSIDLLIEPNRDHSMLDKIE